MQPPLPDKAVFTVREVAAIVDVNVKTLYAEIAAGRFPALRLGRAIRIARSVIVSFLEQGRVAPPGGHNGGETRSKKR